MDQEIQWAAYAGLDFWTFGAYSGQSDLGEASKYYFSSKLQREVAFCTLTSIGSWGKHGSLSDLVSRHIRLMNRDSYFRVLGRRPLYFMTEVSARAVHDYWGGSEAFNDAIMEFRRRALEQSGGSPYIVAFPEPNFADPWIGDIKVDAIGSYAIAHAKGAEKYARLASLAEERWGELARLGHEVVPTVMSGWDRRPRVDHPVPWENRWQKPGKGSGNYYETATPQELADHLERAIDWVGARPRIARANVVLIYAWNENDEGGWLIPTYPHNTTRIDALHRLTERVR